MLAVIYGRHYADLGWGGYRMRKIHVGVEGGISVHVLYNDFKRVYNISKQMPLVC